jgi:hypothetical protein
MLKKKICANFQRIIELFTKKIVTKLSKTWVWDPGSKIRDLGSGKNIFRIPDPGVKKVPDPGSRSATLFLIILISLAKDKISNDILSLVIWFILESRLIMEWKPYSTVAMKLA